MKFYTVHQIAELVQLTPARVYEAIRLDLLPAVHIGRQVRIEEQAFHDWVRSGGQSYVQAGQSRAS
jgi:excisionase family DNA binding protein